MQAYDEVYDAQECDTEELKVGDLMDFNEPYAVNFCNTGMGKRTADKMSVQQIKQILTEDNQTVTCGGSRVGIVVIAENDQWMFIKSYTDTPPARMRIMKFKQKDDLRKNYLIDYTATDEDGNWTRDLEFRCKAEDKFDAINQLLAEHTDRLDDVAKIKGVTNLGPHPVK